ncbi:MAG: hypothetical protein KGI54_05965 [Pseudomonadota bacterium]|nr:hypothetical protein [Pseudomonadota bacterium]
MKIKCPLCESEHSTRLVMGYAQGLSRTRTRTISIGGLFSVPLMPLITGGLFLTSFLTWPIAIPYFLFKLFRPIALFSKSRGTSQNMISVQSQPPYRFPVGKYMLYGFMFFGVVIMAAGFMFRVYHLASGERAVFNVSIELITLALVVFVIMKGKAYNNKIWPLLEAAWQRSFMCKRCGGIFLVPEYDPVGVNAVSSYKGWKKGSLLPESHTQEQKEAVEAKAFDFDKKNLRKE